MIVFNYNKRVSSGILFCFSGPIFNISTDCIQFFNCMIIRLLFLVNIHLVYMYCTLLMYCKLSVYDFKVSKFTGFCLSFIKHQKIFNIHSIQYTLLLLLNLCDSDTISHVCGGGV